MAGDNDSPASNASALVAVGKDLVALLRDAALLVIAVLLVIFPVTFNNILQKAGFEEGSLVGFKWKAKLVENDAALKEAQALITSLKEQNDKLNQTLAEAQQQAPSEALKQQLSSLEQSNAQLQVASSKVAASLANTISSNAPLVRKAQNAIGTSTSWGVVFGGDTALQPALYEVNYASKKLGIADVHVYARQGSYRSVALGQRTLPGRPASGAGQGATARCLCGEYADLVPQQRRQGRLPRMLGPAGQLKTGTGLTLWHVPIAALTVHPTPRLSAQGLSACIASPCSAFCCSPVAPMTRRRSA